MSRLSQELREVLAAHDAVVRDFEQWEARQRKRVERKPQPELIRRDGGFGVQHGREVQTAPQQNSAFMDPEQQKAWDAWVESHIRSALADNFRTVLRPAFGEAMSRYVHERLTRETAKLREEFVSEIAALRADMTVEVRAAKGEIARLRGSAVKRRRDVT